MGFYNSGAIAPLSDEAIVELEMKLLSEAYAEFKDAKVVDSCVKRYQGAVSWFSPGSFFKKTALSVVGEERVLRRRLGAHGFSRVRREGPVPGASSGFWI